MFISRSLRRGIMERSLLIWRVDIDGGAGDDDEGREEGFAGAPKAFNVVGSIVVGEETKGNGNGLVVEGRPKKLR